MTRLLLVIALGSLLVALPSRTRADPTQTERRLKSAGVDDALRKDVHAAIERGVRYLAGRQSESGSFLQPETGSDPEVGATLLVALALRHAGGDETKEPLRGALRYLFEGPATRSAVIERDVYHAGIALMLLASDAGPAERAERIVRSLWRALDAETGWWGYQTRGPGSADATEPDPPYRAFIPNLSTSQFAGLGLQAAVQLGHEAPAEVWERHAEALCHSQLKDGSWMYSPLDASGKVHDPGLGPPMGNVLKVGYFTGTCMGLANLILAREALARTGSRKGWLRSRVSQDIRKGLTALHRGAARCLTGEREGERGEIRRLPGVPGGIRLPAPRLPPEGPGLGHYYALYALEKACIFADLETVKPDPDAPRPPGRGRAPKAKPVPWYAAGARWLLARQREDGGWPASREIGAAAESNPIDTAFALLFLLRSPAVFHPRTPSEVDAVPRARDARAVPTAPDDAAAEER